MRGKRDRLSGKDYSRQRVQQYSERFSSRFCTWLGRGGTQVASLSKMYISLDSKICIKKSITTIFNFFCSMQKCPPHKLWGNWGRRKSVQSEKIVKSCIYELLLLLLIKILKIPDQVHRDLVRCSNKKKKKSELCVL